MALATGDILINMDNDDVYHPWYVAYVVGHMRHKRWHQLKVANVSELMINPDGSTSVTDSVDYYIGAHSMVRTSITLTSTAQLCTAHRFVF